MTSSQHSTVPQSAGDGTNTYRASDTRVTREELKTLQHDSTYPASMLREYTRTDEHHRLAMTDLASRVLGLQKRLIDMAELREKQTQQIGRETQQSLGDRSTLTQIDTQVCNNREPCIRIEACVPTQNSRASATSQSVTRTDPNSTLFPESIRRGLL
jgi:hypothetical protein